MNHLCTSIGLLIVVCHRHRVELTHRVITRQHAAWVLPSNCRASLNLSPRQTCILVADTALGNEVIDTTLAILIAWIPVLYGRVLNLRVALNYNLYNGCMELILIALRCCTTLKVADIRALIGNNQRALKLTRTLGINAEICRELHWATHTLWDVAERAVREYCGVECRVEVVGIAYYRAQVLAHKLRVLTQCL